MGLIKKLVIKDLLLNKKRTIATIVGIVLSLALFVSVLTMYISAVDGLIDYNKKTSGNYHAVFYNVNPSDVDSFKNNREIETINDVKKIGYANIDYKVSDKDSMKYDYACLQAIDKEQFKNLALDFVEGSFPTNEKEVLITNKYKLKFNVSVGDTISLNIGKKVVDEEATKAAQAENDKNNTDSKEKTKSEEVEEKTKVVDAKKESFKVVGVVTNSILHRNYDTDSLPIITIATNNTKSVEDSLYIRYKKSSLDKWAKMTADILGIDEHSLGFYNEGFTYTDKVDEELKKAKYEYHINEGVLSLEKSYIKNEYTRELVPIIIALIAIVMIGSIICIKNSFDISIMEKIKQHAMLKSVGATKKQIRKSVLFEASVMLLIAIPFGIGVGLLAAGIMLRVTNYYIKDIIKNMQFNLSYSYEVIIIAVILVIMTIFISALLPAIKSSRISIIEAIKNSEQIKLKSKKIKAPKYIKKLFGIGGTISYKNMKRNKKKYRKVIIAISISVFLFITIFTLLSFVYKIMETEYKLEYNVSTYMFDENKEMDLNSTLSFDNIKRASIIKGNYRDVKDAKNTTEFKEAQNKAYGGNHTGDIPSYIEVCCLDKAEQNRYLKELGLSENDIKDKAILINYVEASYYDNNDKKEEKIQVYDVNVNDTMELTEDVKDIESDGENATQGENKNNNITSTPVKIACVTDKTPFGMRKGTIGTIYDNGVLVVSAEYFKKIFENAKDKYVDTRAFYYSNDPDKLTSDIKTIFPDEEGGAFIQNYAEVEKQYKKIMSLVSILIYGFIAALFVIGITNIFNTIVSSMQLRKREFATLKSIGMTKKEFRRMIRLESVFVGAKALLIGLVLGAVVILGVTYYALRKMGSFDLFNFKTIIEFTPFAAIAGSIVIVIAVILVIMLYSLNKINKQNIIETIRNDNI